MIVYLNGEYCSASAVQEADLLQKKGLFETIRIDGQRAGFIDDHIQRFKQGAAFLGLQLPAVSLAEIADELIRQNHFKGTGRLKIAAFARKKMKAGIYGLIKPYQAPKKNLYKKGITTRAAKHPLKSDLARVKILDRRPFEKVAKSGIYETLLFDENNHLLEGTRSNVLLIKQSKVFFPPAGRRLQGTMEKQVRQALNSRSITVLEKTLPEKDLIEADALFICNALIGVMPVCKFKDQIIKRQLRPDIQGVLNGFQENYADKTTD